MGKNLDISFQLFKKGTVVLVPQVKFDNGITKAKYAVLLEDAESIWKNGRILACLTTSRKFRRIKSWFSIQPASILGKKEGTTTIDTLNRISLSEDQVKKCKFIGYLSDAQFEDVMEAKAFADMWLRLSGGQK